MKNFFQTITDLKRGGGGPTCAQHDIIWDEDSTGHQTIILGLLAFTIFRSKFYLSNMRGAGEHHIHFSFLMNLELHGEFQMHSNSKLNSPIYPTYLDNTK